MGYSKTIHYKDSPQAAHHRLTWKEPLNGVLVGNKKPAKSTVKTADSSGRQEHSSQNINVVLNAPRTSTERQEAVDAGFAELVGVDPGKVLWSILNWWHEGAKVPTGKSPFGDGKAAERSVDKIKAAGYY